MEINKCNQSSIQTRIMILFILALLMIPLICITYTPQIKQVHAAGNGGQMESDDGSTSQKDNGVSYSRTGFMFYITHKDDLSAIETDAIFISPSAFPDYLDKAHILFATKGAGGASYPNHVYVLSDAPYPVLYHGEFQTNGNAVKAWLEGTEEGTDLPRYLYLIRGTHGEDIYNIILENADDWCVAVEPVAWHALWLNGKAGEVFFATSTAWAALYRHYDCPDGDKQINKFTHKFLPGSMVLEYPMWGFNFEVSCILCNVETRAGVSYVGV